MNTIQNTGANYNTNLSYNKRRTNKKTLAPESSKAHISTDSYTKLMHKIGYTDYIVYEVGLDNGGKLYDGTVDPMSALFHADRREKFNNKFDDILGKNNFNLSSDENIKLTVDKDYDVTVKGMDNQERKDLLENILNNEERFGPALLFHIRSVEAFNGRLDHDMFDKWHVYDFLRKAGQDMSDLKVKDGKLIGTNPNSKFQKIIDAGKSHPFYGMVEKTKRVLAKGIAGIPDMEESIEFYNGSFVDIDVKYGFGTNQIDNWLDDYLSKHKSIDLQG